MWTTLSSHLSSGASCTTPSQTFEMNKRRMEMEHVSWIAGPILEILGWIQCPSPADVEAEGVLGLLIDRIMDLYSLSTWKTKVHISALAVKIWNFVAFKATKQQNSCTTWSHTNTPAPLKVSTPENHSSPSDPSCNTPQYCTTLQHIAAGPQSITPPLATQQHTATHRNTLQHVTTLLEAGQCQTFRPYDMVCQPCENHTAIHCYTMLHTATHCSAA